MLQEELLPPSLVVLVIGFSPIVVHATTFNQGPRRVDLTPEGWLAVSDNGGNANASDNGVAVAHGSGSQSDAPGHSTAVSNAKDNSLSFSIAANDSTSNSNAKDTGKAFSEASDHSTSNANAKDGAFASSIASDHSTAKSNAKDRFSFASSQTSDHSTTDATASKGTTAIATADNYHTKVVHTP